MISLYQVAELNRIMTSRVDGLSESESIYSRRSVIDVPRMLSHSKKLLRDLEDQNCSMVDIGKYERFSPFQAPIP